MHSTLLAPVITLVLWTLIMCVWLYATRIPAVRRNRIPLNPQLTKDEFNSQLSAEVRWKADNYDHLMEQPTIFLCGGLSAGHCWRELGFSPEFGVALCGLAHRSQFNSCHCQHRHVEVCRVYSGDAGVGCVEYQCGAADLLRHLLRLSARAGILYRVATGHGTRPVSACSKGASVGGRVLRFS